MDDILKFILMMFLTCGTIISMVVIYLIYKSFKSIRSIKRKLNNLTVREAIDTTRTAKKTIIRITRKK